MKNRALIGYLILMAFVVWGFYRVNVQAGEIKDQADTNSQNIADIQELQAAGARVDEALRRNVKTGKKASCLIGQVLADLPTAKFSIESDSDYATRLRHTITVLRQLKSANCKSLHVQIDVTSELQQRVQGLVGFNGRTVAMPPGLTPGLGISPPPGSPTLPVPSPAPSPGLPSLPSVPSLPGLPLPLPPLLPPTQPGNGLICSLVPALCP